MNEICRVCGCPLRGPDFKGVIFSQEVDYFDCPKCDYVQTQYPNWLNQAYESVINKSDTGLLTRNENNIRLILATLSILNCRQTSLLDCAGGYGILVRSLRDIGIDAFWNDPYCDNLLAKGFEHSNEKIGLVTAFEAFEHFVDPILECEKFFEYGPNLLLTTTLISKPTPELTDWWYYGLEHGQHVGFYRVKTLQHIAKRFNKYVITDGVSCHLFSEQPVSTWKWNFACKIARKIPSMFKYPYVSKTWSDHMKAGSNIEDTL